VALIGAAYADTPEGHDAVRAGAPRARARPGRRGVSSVIDSGQAEDEAREADRQHRHARPGLEPAERGRLVVEARVRQELSALLGDVAAEIHVVVEDPAPGLIAASEQVDLLVMGSRGLGPKRAVAMGSVSRKVIDRAACPVLVIPRGSDEKGAELLADAAAHASDAR
jgi:nucleotide-binding universal stress UspA family protein